MKKNVSIILFLLTFMLAAFVCNNKASAVSVKSITVKAPSGTTAYVGKGKKITLTPTVNVTPNTAANKKVTYTSVNKKVATVTKKGVVKGIKVGTTKIKVVSKKNKKISKTIKVVVKKPVTKIKLSNTSLKLSVGASKTVTAKITPTKASTSLKWSSSNKNIATVSQKGVVKAIKEGTVKITAKANDGSGIKKSCTLVVSTGIASFEQISNSVFKLTLTSKKNLSLADLSMSFHLTKDGVFKPIPINSIYSEDNGLSYYIEMSDYINVNAWYQISVNSLVSNKTKSVYTKAFGRVTDSKITEVNTYIDEFSVNDDFYTTIDFTDFSGLNGKVTYSVTGLPNGLKYHASNADNALYIYGTFKSIENGTVATIVATDEKNKTYTERFMFFVGDKDTIVGGGISFTDLAYTPDNEATSVNEKCGFRLDDATWDKTLNLPFYFNGGSGEYNYEVTGLPKELGTISKTGEINFDNIACPAGSYNVTLTVTDANNKQLSKSFTTKLILVDGVKISGKITDAENQGVEGAMIDTNAGIDSNGIPRGDITTTNDSGEYQLRVIPNNYTLSIFCCSHIKTFPNINITKDITKNITLPYYRVNINLKSEEANNFVVNPPFYDYFSSLSSHRNELWVVSDKDDAFSVNTGYDKEDKPYYYTYVLPGTYEFDSFSKITGTSKKDSSDALYKVSGNFTVAQGCTITPEITKFKIIE